MSSDSEYHIGYDIDEWENSKILTTMNSHTLPRPGNHTTFDNPWSIIRSGPLRGCLRSHICIVCTTQHCASTSCLNYTPHVVSVGNCPTCRLTLCRFCYQCHVPSHGIRRCICSVCHRTLCEECRDGREHGCHSPNCSHFDDDDIPTSDVDEALEEDPILDIDDEDEDEEDESR